jgi:hypothetical protein
MFEITIRQRKLGILPDSAIGHPCPTSSLDKLEACRPGQAGSLTSAINKIP